MIFRQVKNDSGRSPKLRIAAIVAAVILFSGCETVERIKDAVTPDPAPPKRAAAASESSSPKKAAPIAESSARKAAPAVDASPSNGNAARGASAAQISLNEGIALYDKGQFDAAIRRLNGDEMLTADPAIQIKALKYKAFSYCVTSRQALCRRQFEKALKLDPAFDLEPGEKGHPLWTAEFERAKKKRR